MRFHPGRRAWEEAKNIVRLTLFHPLCQVCSLPVVHRDEKQICRGCRGKIRMSMQNQCRLCGKFLYGTAAVCGACILSPPPFRFHASYAAYDDPLKTLIHRYKYGGIESIKIFFAALYIELHARKVRQRIDMVVPVPADRSRHREFQPVAATARILAAKLAIPFAGDVLLKVRPTPPQAGLVQAERIKNLKGAFRMASGIGLKDKTVLLLDDVYTTGTTVATCSRELARAGAQVIALTLAQSSLGYFSY